MEVEAEEEAEPQFCTDVHIALEAELMLSQSVEACSCRDGAGLTELWRGFAKGVEEESLQDLACGLEAPSLRDPLRFLVVLERDSCHPYGIEFADLSDAGVLVVACSDAESLAAAWNDRCAEEQEPWKRLHWASVVLSVNGVAGDVRRMKQELESSTRVELLACSPPTLQDAAAIFSNMHLGHPLSAAGSFWRRSVDGRTSDTVEVASERCLADGSTPDLTVIVTTSPVPSNPSTNMLEAVLRSFSLVQGLARVSKVLVCDGYTVVKAGQRPRHKLGRVGAEGDVERYCQFIHKVRASVVAAEQAGEVDGPFSNLQVLELQEHHGFGHAIKRALREVRTRFVLVVQHDQLFTRGFHLHRVLQSMSAHPDQLKYVGLCSTTTEHYDQMVRSKFGVTVARTSEFGIPLVPLIFFYDKPHICSLSYYRDVVLGEGSMVQRGEFIEESLGKVQRADILENGMAAHCKYGTWQLEEADATGQVSAVVRHVNGRAFLAPEQRRSRGWPACLRFRV